MSVRGKHNRETGGKIYRMKPTSKYDPVDPPLKPLPPIATHYFQPEKVDTYCNAMSDVLCWLQGFVAGGGEYGPGTIETLRNLNDALKSIQAGHARSNQSHETKK